MHFWKCKNGHVTSSRLKPEVCHQCKKQERDLLFSRFDEVPDPDPMKNPEYYFVIIGPTDRDKLDDRCPMGEGGIRVAAQEAFQRTTGHYAETCASGWGLSEDGFRQMSFAYDSDEMKQRLIQSYYDEGKALPRHMRAWELLFEEEQNNANSGTR